MRLKLTRVRKAGATDDSVVTADAAATISDVAATSARLDLRAGAADRAAEPCNLTMRTTRPGYFDLLILPPDGAVGDAWIGSGASVVPEDAGVHYSPTAPGKPPTIAILRVQSAPD